MPVARRQLLCGSSTPSRFSIRRWLATVQVGDLLATGLDLDAMLEVQLFGQPVEGVIHGVGFVTVGTSLQCKLVPLIIELMRASGYSLYTYGYYTAMEYGSGHRSNHTIFAFNHASSIKRVA